MRSVLVLRLVLVYPPQSTPQLVEQLTTTLAVVVR
jgi:hypothetical protein